MTRWAAKSGRVVFACLAVSITAAFAGPPPKDPKARAAARQRYHDEVKRTYNYRFGKNPWLPSQTLNETGEFMPASDFPTASYCAKCHEEAYRQWRQTAHSNSFRAPFYKRNVDILINTKGIEYTRHCEGCHNPIALFTGSLTKGSKLDRSFDEDGITCMTCHAVARIQNTSGLASFVMGTPAVMLDEQGKPMPGLPTFDEILANPKRHAAAVMKDFYRTPEFCGTCHKAAVPKLLNEYKWLRAFSVYDEWQQSSFAKESPLPFYKRDRQTCQDCHMKAESMTAEDYGAKNDLLKSHRWLGGAPAIPVFYGFDEQLKRTIDFLKADLFNIDIFAVTKESGDEIAPIDRQNFNLAAGERVTIAAYIQNKGIGHTLVPEQRDFYESWVEFKVTDADGKVVTHSGFLKPNGYLDEYAHNYTNWIVGAERRFLNLHQVWQTRIRAYDQTILPGRSDLVRYEFTIPPDAKGPLAVTVNVNYRRFRQEWLEYSIQKKGPQPQYPAVQMATKQIALQLGPNESTPATDAQKEMLRWNNYGIALLGQMQFAHAVTVFKRAVEMKPEYVDGLINVGLAYFSYEKYPEAREWLEKALAKEPQNARALYYQANILRIEGKLEQAAELYQQVIRQFPRFRDAHRELGFIHYQKRKYELARASYEAVQGIDPDDLAAHYQLMLIYKRLGLKDKAAEQAALYADRKEDRAAENYANEFLRANPAVSAESVPWHVHSDRRAAGADSQ